MVFDIWMKEKLKKIDALIKAASTEGERQAAICARERILLSIASDTSKRKKYNYKPKKILEKKCVECGISFQTTSKVKILCSDSCSDKRRRGGRSFKRKFDYCRRCGSATVISMPQGKFCSKKCLSKSNNHKRSDVRRRNVKKHPQKCQSCGIDFFSVYKKKATCSRRCGNKLCYQRHQVKILSRIKLKDSPD